MDARSWYTVTEFAPGTYQINEAGRYNMFLLLGSEKALALDGGIGIGDLRGVMESLTDLPIEHVLTHTHWDHLGCGHQWDKVGVHPVGKSQLTLDHTPRTQGFLKMWDGPLPDGFEGEKYNVPPVTFGWEVKEGDTIELGGRRLRIYDTPGHSSCSISLLDEKEGVLITGDLVKPHAPLFLQVPGAVLSDYAPSLRKLEKLAGETKYICSGHTDPFEDTSIIGEMAQFIEEIEAGKHEPPEKKTVPVWGEMDEYAGGRFQVWLQDHARK